MASSRQTGAMNLAWIAMKTPMDFIAAQRARRVGSVLISAISTSLIMLELPAQFAAQKTMARATRVAIALSAQMILTPKQGLVPARLNDRSLSRTLVRGVRRERNAFPL